MTAFEGLRLLLVIRNSSLAAAAGLIFRNAISLLELLLQHADPADPGRGACETLLRELRRILPPTGDAAAALPAPALPQASARLWELAARMAADREVGGRLRAEALADPDTPQFWQAIGLALFKIPLPAAVAWRERWAAATGEAGAAASWLELPYDKDETILGASPGRSGVRLAQAAGLDRRLGGEVPGTGDDLVGRITSIFLWLAENDPQAWQVFRPVNRFGPEAVNPRYVGAVLGSFAAWRQARRHGDAVAALKQLLDLDEAIHSLWAFPLPDRRSRWCLLQGRLRARLFEAERRVRGACLRDLSGLSVRQVRDFAADDCGIDAGAAPGDVLACLRVHASIAGESLNGRVMVQQLQ
ncbi:hypothetical protein [Rhodovastum atsumiense]|uniref:Uncharacterized protein n=1 Tax=Rhodovastum atsumiense TaxID=504468 RepID=A0A5M6IYJ2_9PROT|nr:hypothetical protein [Rhodovastum atsumiense]KAA5613382.1 hypothetical protein F1189_04795 [Rhodovastum atsumiense]